jgi:hypothetical protein
MTAKRTAGRSSAAEGNWTVRTHMRRASPASTYVWFDGIHGGRNAGRTCWVIGGTMCDGEVQGNFADKFKICGICAFYNSVKEQEGECMIPSMLLLEKMEGNK